MRARTGVAVAVGVEVGAIEAREGEERIAGLAVCCGVAVRMGLTAACGGELRARTGVTEAAGVEVGAMEAGTGVVVAVGVEAGAMEARRGEVRGRLGVVVEAAAVEECGGELRLSVVEGVEEEAEVFSLLTGVRMGVLEEETVVLRESEKQSRQQRGLKR